MAGRLPYPWVARFLAAILFFAAGLKIYGLRVEPVAAGGIFSAVEFQVAIVEFEIVLGIWLWSGVRPILSWLVALVTFSIFAAASGYLAWIGQSSCGCFGAVRVNPLIALGLDGVILLGLVVGRPDLTPLWSNPRELLHRGTLPVLAIIAGMAMVFGVLLSLAQYRFGSMTRAIAHFRGDRVTVQPSLVNAGQGQPGDMRQVTIDIANWTDRPVRVIGAGTDCSCRVHDLPMNIPANESRTLPVTVGLAGKPGFLIRPIVLVVDDEGLKQLTFRFMVRILPKDARPAAEGG